MTKSASLRRSRMARVAAAMWPGNQLITPPPLLNPISPKPFFTVFFNPAISIDARERGGKRERDRQICVWRFNNGGKTLFQWEEMGGLMDWTRRREENGRRSDFGWASQWISMVDFSRSARTNKSNQSPVRICHEQWSAKSFSCICTIKDLSPIINGISFHLTHFWLHHLVQLI